jgi:heterodisulfide reductase subunit A-like polyferredoxin
MTPCQGIQNTADILNVPLAETGFVERADKGSLASESGIYTAGAVSGPMSIPESIASGNEAAFEVAKYLGI